MVDPTGCGGMGRNCLYPYPFADMVRSDETDADGHGTGLTAVADAELAENVGNMAIYGAGADEELLRDLGIGQALAEEGQDFSLADRQERAGVTRGR
jgi:hypothetical protein